MGGPRARLASLSGWERWTRLRSETIHPHGELSSKNDSVAPTSWPDWGGWIRSRGTRFGIVVGTPGSGGAASPGRVGVGADGVDQHYARTGEKYGHTTAAVFESELCTKGEGCDVLTLEDPQRFASSREVGPYLGLVPKQEDSGDSQPQLGISKAGDRMLRRLLVGSSQYMLGAF